MTKRVGLDAAPDDADMVKWLTAKFNYGSNQLLDYMKEFDEVVQMTKDDGDPIEFAYARLLNNLSTLPSPQILEMLAAFIWRKTKP